ncbi:MAG: hypothetical protein K2F59_02580, partial [Eubacteriales bacterium]|nr:hypothetical protein [Eubacteriales bacterium]
MNLFNLILKENNSYNLLKKSLKEDKETILLTNVLESQKSHIISGLTNDFSKTNLIICENDIKAKKYYDDLKFFLKENVFYYPSKDVVFYS